ncbi:MAG TPA: 3-oxoacyl-[acyl-carrier-protein] synthase III C-terminal domain-containing protein [Streptomyces sp.]|nr:3-oxoacyl-[acyl-carrier-protein] synthase III C-terminal domain-containing protein [Streptomyces sp.]
MDGRAVYAHAVRRMTQSAHAALDRAGWSADPVGAFIGHQANRCVLDSVVGRLGLTLERRFGAIRELGNTAGASIPLVLKEPSTEPASASTS